MDRERQERVVWESIDDLRAVRELMQKKSIDRQEADSRINANGKIMKGVQILITNEVVANKLLMLMPTAGALLEHKERVLGP
jgi:hypothetical protein